MKTKIVETHGDGFWGKFLVGAFDEGEWERRSAIRVPTGSGEPALLTWCGWSAQHLLVLDLETGNGTVLHPGYGLAAYDMDKREMGRVCPLYRQFVEWLYGFAVERQMVGPALLDLLPDLVPAR